MFIENTMLAKEDRAGDRHPRAVLRLVAPNVAEQIISGKLEVKKGGQLVKELHRLQQRHPRLHAE
jgi:hypothetical protein